MSTSLSVSTTSVGSSSSKASPYLSLPFGHSFAMTTVDLSACTVTENKKMRYKMCVPEFVRSGLVNHFKTGKIRNIAKLSNCKLKLYVNSAAATGSTVDADYAVVVIVGGTTADVRAAIDGCEALFLRMYQAGKYRPSFQASPLLNSMLNPAVDDGDDFDGDSSHSASDLSTDASSSIDSDFGDRHGGGASQSPHRTARGDGLPEIPFSPLPGETQQSAQEVAPVLEPEPAPASETYDQKEGVLKVSMTKCAIAGSSQDGGTAVRDSDELRDDNEQEFLFASKVEEWRSADGNDGKPLLMNWEGGGRFAVFYGDIDAEMTDTTCSGDEVHVQNFIKEVLEDKRFYDFFTDDEFCDVVVDGSPDLATLAHEIILEQTTVQSDSDSNSRASNTPGQANKNDQQISTFSSRESKVRPMLIMALSSRESADSHRFLGSQSRDSLAESSKSSGKPSNHFGVLETPHERAGLETEDILSSPYLSSADSHDHDMHGHLSPPSDGENSIIHLSESSQSVKKRLSVRALLEKMEASQQFNDDGSQRGADSGPERDKGHDDIMSKVTCSTSELSGVDLSVVEPPSLYDIFLVRQFLISCFEFSNFTGDMDALEFSGSHFTLVDAARELATGLLFEREATLAENEEAEAAISISRQFPCPRNLLVALLTFDPPELDGSRDTRIANLAKRLEVDIHIEECPDPNDCLGVINRMVVSGTPLKIAVALRSLESVLAEALANTYHISRD